MFVLIVLLALVDVFNTQLETPAHIGNGQNTDDPQNPKGR
jgi:hypothetical protein